MANCVSVMTKMLPSRTSLSLAMEGEPGKRHNYGDNVRAQQHDAVSDWLNPFSLGTMSASAYIENLA